MVMTKSNLLKERERARKGEKERYCQIKDNNAQIPDSNISHLQRVQINRRYTFTPLRVVTTTRLLRLHEFIINTIKSIALSFIGRDNLSYNSFNTK